MADRSDCMERAQELGFSHDETTGPLRLEDGIDRAFIRWITVDRLGQIERKLSDLRRMHSVWKPSAKPVRAHTRSDLPGAIIVTLAVVVGALQNENRN